MKLGAVCLLQQTCFQKPQIRRVIGQELIVTGRNFCTAEMEPISTFIYPTQFSIEGIIGLIPVVIASIIESVGDYNMAAIVCELPSPPAHAINRGIFVEGVFGCLAGLFGAAHPTTSYSTNIALMKTTRVSSRLVFQTTGVMMIVMAIFTKCGAFLALIPTPIIGGMFMAILPLLISIGISSTKHTDMSSSRNLIILGFSIFIGILVPDWFQKNSGALSTGNITADNIISVFLRTGMFISGLCGFLLDNIVPGTREDRGLTGLKQGPVRPLGTERVYRLPFGHRFFRRCPFKYIPICSTFGEGTFLSDEFVY